MKQETVRAPRRQRRRHLYQGPFSTADASAAVLLSKVVADRLAAHPVDRKRSENPDPRSTCSNPAGAAISVAMALSNGLASLSKRARNQLAHDLGRAAVDTLDSRVRVEPTDLVLAHEAVAAEELQASIDGAPMH
jgi:hypothetical protein